MHWTVGLHFSIYRCSARWCVRGKHGHFMTRCSTILAADSPARTSTRTSLWTSWWDALGFVPLVVLVAGSGHCTYGAYTSGASLAGCGPSYRVGCGLRAVCVACALSCYPCMLACPGLHFMFGHHGFPALDFILRLL
ncbi:hypothetical protein B0H13DRAFT_1096715 [Mycena leptocephala]|nr:hypothetical protein B0H13DRAFT_1096715 [Mycena leptocephala]